MIELAAQTWQIPLDLALQRLANGGMPIPPGRLGREAFDGYRIEYGERRQRLQELWRVAQAYILQPKNAEVNGLQIGLSIRSFLSKDRWKQGPGYLYGAVPIDVAQQVLAPGNAAIFPGRIERRGRDRLGVGKGWGDLLVVPYSDLPGRVCGFEFIGRAASPKDRFYYSGGLDRLRRTQVPGLPAEAGLAGWPLAEEAAKRSGHMVLAVRDAAVLLRLQVKHFHTSLAPLPIVAWRDDDDARTSSTWKTFASRRRVVFWTQGMHPASVAQAIAIDGWLALEDSALSIHNTGSEIFRRERPTDLLDRLFGRARPWANALAQWLEVASDGAAETLLARLEQKGVDVGRLAKDCPAAGRRLARLPRSVPERQIWLGTQEIVECSGRWFVLQGLRREADLLFDAIIRLDRVVAHGEATLGYGRLCRDGKELEFEVDVAQGITPGWLTRLCVRHRLAPVYCRRGWSHRLVEIAWQLQPPTCELPDESGSA